MIFGDRIRLRAMERADLPHFQRWLNDPEVRMGIMLYTPVSQIGEERWFDQMVQRPVEEQPLAVEIQDGDSWKLIGNCGLFGYDWRVRSAELGILIGDKTEWDQGYGTEATMLIVGFGFQTLNLRRVFLRVFANNPRAIRAYEKAGFMQEGRLRQASYHDGDYVDVIMMGLLRSDWETSQGGS